MMLDRFPTLTTPARWRDEFDRLFDDFFAALPDLRPLASLTTSAFPSMNVWEGEQGLFVEAEVPGLRLADLEVTVEDRELTLKGERKQPEEANAYYHLRERGAGRFTKVVRLPFAVDRDKIEARLENGVLTVTLPRAENARPRRIVVQESR